MTIFWTIIFGGFTLLCYAQEGNEVNPMIRTGATAVSKTDDANFLSNKTLADSTTIDSIVIYKSAHIMQVFNRQQPLKQYKVHLGVNPVGAKQVSGDGKTPEGKYFINAKNAVSMFHKSLGISYPNEEDIKTAKKLMKSPGDDIVIHGLPNGSERLGKNRYRNDWTWGCIALGNTEIDELFEHVKIGTPVLILP